jgi:DNA-binding response OmpR family regulator
MGAGDRTGETTMVFQASQIHIFPGMQSRVLLIEKPLHGELIKMVLQKSGITVYHARDYDEAEQAVRSFKPDAILASLNEDGLDGREIVFHLKCEHSELRGVPVILMSEIRLSEAARRDLVTLGVNWVLEKPIVPTSLPKLVRETVREASVLNDRNYFARKVGVGQTASSALMASVG